MSPEELEAKIRAKMDEEITGLVGQYQASQRKTLDEIEATAVGLGQHVREIALQEMLAAHAECSITNSLKMAYRLVLPLSKVPSNHSKVDYGAGMPWNREGAQPMVLIRAARLDHSFDDPWHAAA